MAAYSFWMVDRARVVDDRLFVGNLNDVGKGSKTRSLKVSLNLRWDMLLLACGKRKTSDALCPLFVAGFVDLMKKRSVPRYLKKGRCLAPGTSSFMLCGARCFARI